MRSRFLRLLGLALLVGILASSIYQVMTVEGAALCFGLSMARQLSFRRAIPSRGSRTFASGSRRQRFSSNSGSHFHGASRRTVAPTSGTPEARPILTIGIVSSSSKVTRCQRCSLNSTSTEARYLSPEPVRQSSRFLISLARAGYHAPGYSYAANNPAQLVDPNGLEFVNSSSYSVRVKSESSGWGVVPPHTRYPKKIDGWEDPITKKLYKVRGKDRIPFDNRVQCGDGPPPQKDSKDKKPLRYDCTGGPCRLTGFPDAPDPKEDLSWAPPESPAPFPENKRL